LTECSSKAKRNLLDERLVRMVMAKEYHNRTPI
jgi:hypothetical protein